MIAQILRKKIAIVDDEQDLATVTGWDVEAADFESFIVKDFFREVDVLASYIEKNAQGALCDHRLANYGRTNFSGATLVAELYDRKIPSILITQYTEIDANVSIRKSRRKIPVLLSRDEANAATIKKGIEDCVLELDGKVPITRIPHRTLLNITHITNESNEKVIDVIVPSWNPHKAVRLPASLIPQELHSELVVDRWLFADVNTGAEKSDDLYFERFELTPEPDEDDGLA
ncbi:hypothetical protein [Microcoleus sp.]|uniref:hypothetical protein n=1 Tax=Microcoleus sp. TaxID=44472 RepID=UPI00403E8DDB